MTGIPGAAILIVLAYLIGALPFGLLVGRLAGGVDLREHGSGRIGATNALRTVGWTGAVLTLLLDLLKGVVAVLLVWWLYQAGPAGSTPWVGAAAGIAAVAGHIRSVFIGFRGGRGWGSTRWRRWRGILCKCVRRDNERDSGAGCESHAQESELRKSGSGHSFSFWLD